MIVRLTYSAWLILFLSFSGIAQEFPSIDQLEALQFRSLGPHRGGRVTAVTGVPSQWFTFFFGSTGGGIWKTTDGGLNWTNVSDGFLKSGSIGAIEVAPSDPNVIYAGTGSAAPRGNVSPGDGMYKSLDGGQSWTHIGLPKAGQIGRLAIHPKNPDLVYAAVLGNVFGPSEERGVYRSENGGTTWEKVLFISDKTGAIDLVMDPNNPRILYAGMWTAQRKPWTLIDGSQEGGVWKSIDGGNSWKKVEAGLPSGLVGKVGIAISPANPKRIWVLQEAADETKGGLYRSDDGGKSFQRINRNHNLRQRAWYYNHIFAHPTDENTVFVLNVRMQKSIDGGKSFSAIRTPHSDNHALWINPEKPEIMIEGNDGGACVSFNSGSSWTTQLNQPTAEFYRVSTDNQWPYRVYGAQQDNTTISVSSRNSGGLTPYQDWYAVGGGESGHIAIDPRDPNIFYAGTYIGQIDRTDRARQYARDVVAYPQMHDGTAPRDIVFRFQWNAPIRISPHDPNTVYHCSQYVHRTRDKGHSWEIISPDLTTNKDDYQDIPGGPIQHDHTGVELYTTIFAFEESPFAAGELWAGTDDGRLHLTRNHGKDWTEITPPDLPAEGTINSIDLSLHAPGRAFIAVYKYRENDFSPYIFQTEDYGKTWKKRTNGIPEGHFVRVVREDPDRQGLLYAGTEYGLYVSFNAGASWTPFQNNLPITPITDLQVKEGNLVIATQGRSFWMLDHLTPLHEWSEAITSKAGHLFKPQTAYRQQVGRLGGTGSPDPTPRGASLFFYLKESMAQDSVVRLSILDRYGKNRRIFSSQPDKAKGEEKLVPKTGLNRLTWDMRFEKPIVQKGAQFSLASLSGIKAPPGVVSVKLEVGDMEFRDLLRIEQNPHWDLPQTDFDALYDLTWATKSLLDTCHQIIGTIRSVRNQLTGLEERMGGSKWQKEAERQCKSLKKQLNQLEKRLIQTKSESGQDPINYPPMLDDQIAYLYSVLNNTDGAPTSGSLLRFSDLKAAFEGERQQFDALINGPLTAFNQWLDEHQVQVIMSR